MSLPQIAQHLAGYGRNGDSTLVHMTPNEVKGLHAIANATGQKITTNPDTGLPEAFSLEGFLPMLAGAALAPFTGGMSAALLVGGGYGLATGSLEQGLIAGLGAFGGHGLATGLMGAGASAASTTGTAAAAPGATTATTTAPAVATTTTAATPAAATTNTLAAPNLATTASPTSYVTPGFETLNPIATGTPTAATAAAPGSTAANEALKQQYISGAMKPPTPLGGGPNAGFTSHNPLAGGASPAVNPPVADVTAAAADKTALAADKAISRPVTDTFNKLTTKGSEGYSKMGKGLEAVTDSTDAAAEFLSKNKLASASAVAPAVLGLGEDDDEEDKPPPTHPGMIRPYEFERTDNPEAYASQNYDPNYTGERLYFTETFTELPAYEAPGPEYKNAAKGGIMSLATGGNTNMGNSTGSKGSEEKKPDPNGEEVVMAFRKPSGYEYSYDPSSDSFMQLAGPGVDTAKQMPTGKELAQGIGAQDALKRFNEMNVKGEPYSFTPSWASDTASNNPATGGLASLPPSSPASAPASGLKPLMQPVNVPAYQSPEERLGLNPFYAHAREQMDARYAAGMAKGGLSNLGGYSDGGRMLKGPGDGMSDDIPANIGGKQPARLADGEFVVPADVVSHLGNGSTDAGAKKLYKMMAAVRKARTGNSKQGKKIKPEKYLPAR
jgi:hypothetical protein